MADKSEYTVHDHTNLVDLTRLVNNSIKRGWQPLGGLSAAAWFEPGGDGGRKTHYAQAMVR